MRRYVWLDMCAASQNLLQGNFRDEENHPPGTPGHYARREPLELGLGGAVDAADELLLYATPLTAKWTAPPHPFMLAERGEPPSDWTRRGPYAMTRGWCIFEMVKMLANGAKLHVVLKPADVTGFRKLLEEEFDELANIFANIDARDAQLTMAQDSEYILPDVKALGGSHTVDGGLGDLTARVCEEMNKWLVAQGKAELARLPAAERGTSLLL